MQGVLSGRRMLGAWVGLLALALGAGAAGNAASAAGSGGPEQPVEIAEFLPQGRVSGVEAVQLRFSGSASAFGDAAAVAPVALDCQGRVPQGQGRWLDDTRWIYVFDTTLPAGVHCAARANPGFRDLAGQPLAADLRYEFNTGAPSVADVRPYSGTTIDEEQVFILRFDAAVDAALVAQQSHCVVQGVGEKIPVRQVSGEYRESLMRAAYLPQPVEADSLALLQCARVLPPEAQVRLEVGPGIRALEQAGSLPGSQKAEIWEYEVRPPFMASLSCQRERAGQPCLPMTPVSVTFSAPVPREALQGISLRAGDQQFEVESDTDGQDFLSYVRFPGPFPANATLTLALLEGLQDDAGRALENSERFPLAFKVAGYPPLAKFASGTFGVIERFAHGRPGAAPQEAAAVPVTLRHVEADLTARGMASPPGRVSNLRSVDDAQVLG
ncbi:MAG: alpha-2-macroglobulin, partial [Alcaligenaceae bacterium]|nr:alpha-2-macroglobulin [Alcaligenaceae bacterium]